MPNKVGESFGSSLIFWRMSFPSVEPRVVLEADDRLGAFGLAVPSAAFVLEHGHAAPERLVDRAGSSCRPRR